MTKLQHSLIGLFASDMHVYSRALLFHAHLLSDPSFSLYLSTCAIPLIFSFLLVIYARAHINIFTRSREMLQCSGTLGLRPELRSLELAFEVFRELL